MDIKKYTEEIQDRRSAEAGARGAVWVRTHADGADVGFIYSQ